MGGDVDDTGEDETDSVGLDSATGDMLMGGGGEGISFCIDRRIMSRD